MYLLNLHWPEFITKEKMCAQLIPGRENIEAQSVELTPEEMTELESFAGVNAVKGDRYGDEVPTWKKSDTSPLSSWKAS